MTAVPSNSVELDDVLDAIAEQPHAPTGDDLRNWMSQYPQFKDEIIEFATAWVELDALPDVPEPSEDEVNSVVNRTMSRVQELLSSTSQTPITNLTAEMASAGHDSISFQRMLGIDASILTCLVDRMIKPATIPLKLVESLAQSLGRMVEDVRAYLLLPPQLATAYKAKKKPVASQADFAVLVTYSNLTEPEKSRWLSEPVDKELAG